MAEFRLSKRLIVSLLFVVIMRGYSVSAQTILSAQDKLEIYLAQANEAEQDRNVQRLATVYAKIVELCRNNPVLEDKLAENLYHYGLWSSYAGNYQQAIHAQIEILEMPDSPDDQSLFTLKARTNMQLGVTFFFMERWDDALIHYQRARDMAMVLDNKLGVSIAENNIGNIYQKKENYELAIRQYQQSLKIQEELGDKETICNTLYNLGTCYDKLEMQAESLPYFEDALQLAEEISDIEIHALTLTKLALYNVRAKRLFDQAITQMEEAEKLADGAGYKQVLKEVFQIRSIIEEEKGDPVVALAYYKKFKQMSDTLLNASSIEKLHEFEVRYETKEKELEIVRQQAEIDKHNTRQYLYIGGLAVAGVLLILLVYIVQLRNKRNRILAETNTTKDKFFSIISHDLKNPAIAQRDALQLLTEHAGTWDVNSLATYYEELLRSADGQVELLYNLLNWAQVQTGRMPYTPTEFDLVAELRSDIALTKNMADRKGITFNTETPDEAIVTGDINMIATVVRNLLTNAIKFTGEAGTITLEITKEKIGRYKVSVADTGTGMTPEQIATLFNIDRNQSRTGTAGEQGSGLGFIVCRELLEKHGTRLQVESTPGKGSRFFFLL